MATIELAGGKSALIDDDDAELCASYTWYLAGRQMNYVYGRTKGSSESRERVSLHRLIMGAKPGQIVDHANRDTFDNRRANLRFATANQSQGNTDRKAGASGYRGVKIDKRTGRFIARGCGVDYIGVFDKADDAARAYDAAAIKAFGRFATLNFPSREAA